MSDDQASLQSYYVKSFEQHELESHWMSKVPAMRHQLRFIMTKVGNGAMMHAGVAILLNQHRSDREMLYYEPLKTRQEVPDVVVKWARKNGVTRISIFNGEQRRGNIQCIRFSITFYVKWLRANQNLIPRGATAIWDSGTVTKTPRPQRSIRTFQEVPRKYWEGILPNNDTVDQTQMMVNIAPVKK